MRSRRNRSAAATAVKNVASVSARRLRCCALNGVRMLVDASIITLMRRPGYVTSLVTSAVNGSARARVKKGRPARKSASGTCRASATGEERIDPRSAGTTSR